MSKESKMEPLEKTWLLEIIVAAMLAALLGLWGWTANKVVQNGESIIEVRVEIAEVQAELQQEIGAVKEELQQEIGEVRVEIGEVKAELGEKIAENGKSIAAVNGKIAAVDAKLDLLIRGLNIAVAPKDKAGAGPAGAKRGGLRVGAGGETATE